jgi:predicted RNA-binding protein Jag
MTTIPKGAVTAEARTLNDALKQAASELGVPAMSISYKIDREHFLSKNGTSTGMDTVKIAAWARDPAETAGAEAARLWLVGLIEKMGFEATVGVRLGTNKHATLLVDSESGRYLVGRQGATLRAIQEMLEAAMSVEHGDWNFRMDIGGGREREERRDDRGGRRDDRGGRRDDRGGRRDDRGGRRDDRGGRRDDRGGRRDDRGGRSRRSDEDVAALERLAQKLAARVLEDGKPIDIRQALNSFERRIVHITIAEIDGVSTASFMDGDDKRVRILREGSEE